MEDVGQRERTRFRLSKISSTQVSQVLGGMDKEDGSYSQGNENPFNTSKRES